MLRFSIFLALKLIAQLGLLSVTQAQTIKSTAYTACMDKAQGVTLNMLECTWEENKRQDAQLNANYKKLQTTLSVERRNELLQTQKAWVRFRELNCKFYHDPAGGSASRLMSNDCYLRMTTERAQELKQLNP